ncbi:Pectate lyase superfamily protein [Actinopolymorpha cephalotaxi]|uniref:Pectate lyase superfamily protein n=1 Tax=Actinopolymorpha cephalotaxi TaxID=504797 RepID=A0A1I3CBC8_9ACTN|nr:glycosyl hydrolase family 28-related protein [Actinopolymorpha cephalotaxi]NYH86722.1 hypothetical protein [Actinopolymorpha cephalotaxi]SFH71832.1 Pectate lyase superfamily protein [Actinopolymorpha cephalotaxi]
MTDLNVTDASVNPSAVSRKTSALSRKNLVRSGAVALLGAAALAGPSRRAEAAPTPPHVRGEFVPNDDPRVNLVIDVRAWGAKGDGTTDDTRAIQAALDAATHGETVLFPEGRYRITKTLTHQGALGLSGLGQGLSVIDWAGAGDAIKLTFSSGASADYLMLRDLTVNSTRPDAGTAVSAVWSEPYAGAWPHATIDALEVTRGDGNGQRWQCGLYLQGAWRSTVTSYSFTSAAHEGVGIQLEGQCVDCYLVDMHLSNCDTPILLGWATEGTVIENAVMVGPRHGLRCKVNDAGRKGPWFTLRDSHCNSLASAVEMEGTGDAWVVDNLFYKTPGSSDDYVGVKLTNCRQIRVRGNEIYNISAEDTTNNGIELHNSTECLVNENTTVNLLGKGSGIIVDHSPDARVMNNYSRNVGTGIRVTAGSDRCMVTHNAFRITDSGAVPGAAAVVNDGKDNLVESNTDFRTG